MPNFQRAILTHGGAGSNPKNFDGPKSAANRGMDLMANGETALTAVVDAVTYLEDDPRFNAGSGSRLRIDGHTMQLDASCMTGNNEFGAVACVENIKNPIAIAHGVLRHSPHILLVGDGVRIFAEEYNIPVTGLSGSSDGGTSGTSCDTVGAVAFDGTTFAAALNSGGLENQPWGGWVMSHCRDAVCFVVHQGRSPAPGTVNLSPLNFWQKKFTPCWKTA